MPTRANTLEIPLGIGYYTVPDAARLLRIPDVNIRRWLVGYPVEASDGKKRRMPPLWRLQLPRFDRHVELGFRDLIELRFVTAFLNAGLSIVTIRECLDYARTCVDDERPFSTRRFRTDGRTIFFEIAEQIISDNSNTIADEVRTGMIDLRRRQYVFRDVIAQTFKDLDLDNDVVVRWRPFRGKDTIVIDPQRAFGQPIANGSGVPTITIAAAVEAEGSAQRTAFLYDIPLAVVRDAIAFEHELAAT